MGCNATVANAKILFVTIYTIFASGRVEPFIEYARVF